MACNCKVNQQISKLKEEYGIKGKNKKTKKIKITLKKIMTWLCVLLILPFIFIYVLSVVLFTKDKMIDVRKIFLKKHGN